MTRAGSVLAGVAALAGLVPLSGCMTMLTRAYYEARGAQGKIEFVADLPQELSRYQSVRFEPVTTTLGPRLCPPEVRAAYDRAAEAQLPELRAQFPGGEPVLVIASEIVYYKEKGLFGHAHLLSRVRFRENESLVGDALVVAGSSAYRAGGAAALAEAALKSIARRLAGEPAEEEKERDGGGGGQ